ncbi:MAG: C-terminal binding protein [Gulosibacter sp.]|uniref:C-terminal binding protein n=1 Tax=Gulosibacter sp. TaxID=2817531 RepID=UPI003F91657F
MTEQQQPLVLFAEYTDLDPEPARALLGEVGIRTDLMRFDAGGQVVAEQRNAVGIIAGYSTIDAGLIAQFPELGIIAASSNGTNMIDVDAAVSRGVWVTNVAHAATEEVAVHTLAMALSLVRELPQMARTTASGGWTDDLPVTPRRVSSLTLGIVGYGKIGALVARYARPMFGRVIAYDPFRSEADENAELVSLDEVLETADVVSLHMPLTPDTEGMIGAAEIARMRDGAILLNVSRGELVDAAACFAALETGKLAGVGLDVLDGEPPAVDDPFRTHPRAVVTPHAAFLSDEALRSYEIDPVSYIADWYRDGAPSAGVVGAPQG